MNQEVEPSSLEKKVSLEKQIRKKNFIDYKKIESIKSDLLRLEAKRAQLNLDEDEKKLALIEKKIMGKKEKLMQYFHKYLDEK